ncbi:lipid-A-disaccharide synthase N-terminal domain-containing protein [Pontibacter sp. BT731]|uniref:lipid-A-disaccharide synthase N-terminal domain-containing protein n=1 Tax=Pontibacter coccineus TaxID=3063328 RepID=UPI0026E41C9C|nr:lipid-A-disaccharide synthase N-terminal domain-containing protein [Pontibacter sp. BT731]MDO6391794.1 lipid-A-disaccharide synthase N-terminal domain-containing protein [Pontibacter sp. BT731]
MSRSEIGILSLGLMAQVLFSSRILVQWIKSERAGRVLSPTSFWTFSLLASFLLMLYGMFRQDLVIIGGQVISYLIYLRNLQFKGVWNDLPAWLRWSAVLFPVVALAWLLFGDEYSLAYIWEHSKVSGLLIAWGGAGQVIFTLRFVYQWYYSELAQESILPNGFWVISLVGSLMIVTYAVLRLDPVLLLGQVVGLVAYSRNLYLGLQKQSTSQRSVS